MTYRKVFGLESAYEIDRPDEIPVQRTRRGAKGRGLAYEHQVAEALPHAFHGPWYEYWDANGRGWCQPDLVLRGSRIIVVCEVKLTWTPQATSQLSDLYVPILLRAHNLPVRSLIICRNLTPRVPFQVYGSMREALSSSHTIPIVHWLGHGPLV